MPVVEDINDRFILRLGESIQDININQVVDLLLQSHKKIEIKIQDDLLERIIKRDEEFMRNMTNKKVK
jgi:hypothetical protein